MSDFLNNGADFNLGGNGGNTGVTATADKGGFVFDLTSVEENTGGFEVLPKGKYDAVVDELEFGESKAGNPMITVKYSITTPEYENRIIFDYWVLGGGKAAEFGLAKLKKFLVRVCPDVDLSAFNPQSFSDQGTAIGRLCTLTLGIQTQKAGEYKGEKRNTVKDVEAQAVGSFL